MLTFPSGSTIRTDGTGDRLTGLGTEILEAALALRYPCIGYWGPRAVWLDTESGDLEIQAAPPRGPRVTPLGLIYHWLPNGQLLWSFYRESLS